MLRNKFISAALCAALAFSLAGCMEQAASDVSDTASRIESGAGEAVSRVESDMEEAGSRVGSAVGSALDPDESRPLCQRGGRPFSARLRPWGVSAILGQEFLKEGIP